MYDDDKNVFTFQLIDLRIEDNHPKCLRFDERDEIIGDSFVDAFNASEYQKREKSCKVYMFGRTDTDHSITVIVNNFKPFLFFRKKDFSSTNSLLNLIVDAVNKDLKYYEKIDTSDLSVKEKTVKHAYGFEPNEDNTDSRTYNYYQVFFPNKKSWNIISKRDNTSAISKLAHEKNVDCITRFFNETNISPGWVTVEGERVEYKVSTSTLEIECNISNVKRGHLKGYAKLRVGYWDIETLGLETNNPICTIGITVKTYGRSRERHVIQVGKTSDIEGVNLISVNNETELLNTFRDKIIEFDLDGLVTYNGTNFDEKFVYERASILNVDRFYYCSRFAFKKCFKKTIMLSSAGMGDNELTIFETPGICHFDWYIKFKTEDKEPSYKLNYYGEKYCNAGKDPVSYWEIPGLANGTPDERARLAKYCGIDCDLLDDLEGKRNIFSDLFNLSTVCLVLPQWVYFKGQQVRYISQLLCKARKKNMILNVPEMGWSGNSSSQYDGAIVFEPIRGYYEEEPVNVLDYMSLYPSIIMAHNFSPDTLVQKPEFYNLDGVECHKISGKENVEYYFTTKVKGILPEILEDLMSERKQTKKELKIAEQELETETDEGKRILLKQEILNLDGKQKALKISANSLYGAMGAFSTGTYICLAAAESTTNMARRMLIETKEFLEQNYDCTVVYGDTDSCMVKFNGITDLQESGKMASESAKAMTKMYAERGYPKKVLEFEDTLFPCLFLNKKRYIGYMYVESKDGSMIPKGIYCKGVESERRDFCKFAKDVYGEVIDGLIVKRSLKTALEKLDTKMKELINNEIKFESFILNKNLSKSYKAPENQPHLQVNEKKKKRNPGSENAIGERVDFVIVQGPPNSKLADLAEDPEYVKEKKLKIDTQWYCEHQVKEPITRLFEPIENVPKDLFTRYVGELKRKRLNISSLCDFQTDEKECENLLKISKTIKNPDVKKDKKTHQSSLFDFSSDEKDNAPISTINSIPMKQPKKNKKK